MKDLHTVQADLNPVTTVNWLMRVLLPKFLEITSHRGLAAVLRDQRSIVTAAQLSNRSELGQCISTLRATRAQLIEDVRKESRDRQVGVISTNRIVWEYSRIATDALPGLDTTMKLLAQRASTGGLGHLLQSCIVHAVKLANARAESRNAMGNRNSTTEVASVYRAALADLASEHGDGAEETILGSPAELPPVRLELKREDGRPTIFFHAQYQSSTGPRGCQHDHVEYSVALACAQRLKPALW